MFSTEQKNEIKARIDIVDFISNYVVLKRSGSIYWGKCPFHEDSSPSFSVSPNRGGGIWKCWSNSDCGSGDIFSFYMKKHKVDFATAVMDLARMNNIPIDISDELKSEYEKKSEMYKINLDALSFYQNAFKYNSKAKTYLESRCISNKIIETFKLGADDMIENHLTKELTKKYSLEQLVEVGLIGLTEDNKSYEIFKNRLVIPIFDELNRVLGFTARTLNSAIKPKYKNTKETLIYNKRDVLYGINWAQKAIQDNNNVIVVEGQFDVIRPISLGIFNVVAISGKEMTSQQALKLGKLTNNFTLCFDSDNAGKEAIEKAYSVIKENVRLPNIKVMSLE